MICGGAGSLALQPAAACAHALLLPSPNAVAPPVMQAPSCRVFRRVSRGASDPICLHTFSLPLLLISQRLTVATSIHPLRSPPPPHTAQTCRSPRPPSVSGRQEEEEEEGRDCAKWNRRRAAGLPPCARAPVPPSPPPSPPLLPGFPRIGPNREMKKALER